MVIRSVVAAVDGSHGSLQALDWAADEAVRRDVPLRLVHACPWERYERDVDDEGDPMSIRAETRTLVADALDRATRRQPAADVSAKVLPEDTVTALLGLGHEDPLLVIGSRGHGGFAGLLLGSVSLRVAARATCPVVVVPDVRPPDRPRGRVVLGVGGEAGAAVGFAVEEAGLRRAELHLVHGRHPDSHDPTGGSTADPAFGAAGDLPPGVTVHRHESTRRAAHALLEAGADADLVVVGSAHRSGRTGLHLGPVGHALVHHAPCPVAVVPAD